MANRLKMAKVNAILQLRERGWSQRRIARELGVHRVTVGEHVRAAEGRVNPANVTLGTAAPSEAKPAKVTLGIDASPEPVTAPLTLGSSGEAIPKPAKVTLGIPASRSQCSPLLEAIKGKLELGLSAQRIWQDLRDEQAFAGSYSSVKRFVRRLG